MNKKIVRVIGTLFISFFIFISFLFIYKFIWGNIPNFVISIDNCTFLFCDFMNHYYPTGSQLFKTFTPGPQYFYSSFFALILSMIAQVPLLTALYIWLAIQLLLLVILILIPSLFLSKKSISYHYLHLILILSSYPILSNFKWGQVSVLIVAMVFCSLFFYEKGFKFTAATLLAFAISIKYYICIVLFYFLFKKDKKFLLFTFVMVLIFSCILPISLLGYDQNLKFYKQVLREISFARTWIPTAGNSQFFPNVIMRWQEMLNISIFNRMWLTIFSYGIVFFQILMLGCLYYFRKFSDCWLTLSVLLCLTPFFVETSWPHYFVYLPFCQALILTYSCEGKKIDVVRLLTGVSIFMNSFLYFKFFNSWVDYNAVGSLFIANTLALIGTWMTITRRFNGIALGKAIPEIMDGESV